MLLLSTALKKGKWLPSRKCAVPSASANLGMIHFPPNLETTLRCSIDKTMRCCEQAARETCGEESSIVCLIPRGCAESLLLSFETGSSFLSQMKLALGNMKPQRRRHSYHAVHFFCSYSVYSGLSVQWRNGSLTII